MTPKSLLRHPMAISNFEEMGPGTSFKHIIPDSTVKLGNVKKVLLCTGKVYYDLVIERQEKQLEDKIAIVRIEQLCPFPYHLLATEMMKYPRAKVRNFRDCRINFFNTTQKLRFVVCFDWIGKKTLISSKFCICRLCGCKKSTKIKALTIT